MRSWFTVEKSNLVLTTKRWLEVINGKSSSSNDWEQMEKRRKVISGGREQMKKALRNGKGAGIITCTLLPWRIFPDPGTKGNDALRALQEQVNDMFNAETFNQKSLILILPFILELNPASGDNIIPHQMFFWQPILMGLVLRLTFGTIHSFYAMAFHKYSTLNL